MNELLKYLIVPFILGFIWFLLNKREKEKDKKEKLINDIANKYVNMAGAHPPINSGIQGLIKAGINDLQNDKEIRRTFDIIKSRGIKHPFLEHRNKLDDLDNIDFNFF